MAVEERLAIILAGDEGEDRKSLTHGSADEDVPRQFCAILGESTVLEQTCQRVGLVVPDEQTLIVVTRAHGKFYEPLLRDIQPRKLVVQPLSRGMGPAILCALQRVRKITRNAALAIFPAHHYVEDDAAFMRHIELAFEGIKARPDLVVLMGATPDGPDEDYCWIEMGDRVAEYLRLSQIRGLRHKPSHQQAMLLWQLGWLWNSSVIVAQLPALLSFMQLVCPQLFPSFDNLHSMGSIKGENEAVEAIYAAICEQDFWYEVAARCPSNLAVLPVAGVEWSDLGRLRRVLAILRRNTIRRK